MNPIRLECSRYSARQTEEKYSTLHTLSRSLPTSIATTPSAVVAGNRASNALRTIPPILDGGFDVEALIVGGVEGDGGTPHQGERESDAL
jgi:hypothetical protein